MDSTAPIGHEAVRSQTHALFQASKLHSTLLFSGVDGIGKKLSALELSRTILCEGYREKIPQGGCGSCKSCVMCESGNHTDRILVECADKDLWDLDAIRGLLYSLNLKPFQGSQRVVIFNDADYLSLQACNVLLKTLEEPRPGNWFLLVSSNPSKLPITLRSRCQVWSFAPLQPEELSKIIAKLDPDDTSALSVKEISKLADGSVGVAQLLLEHASEAMDVKGFITHVKDGDASAAISTAAEWAKDRPTLRTKLSLCRIFGRSLLLNADDPDLRSRAASFLTNILSSERLIFDRNINAQLVLQRVFFALLPAEVLGTYPRLSHSEVLIDLLGV